MSAAAAAAAKLFQSCPTLCDPIDTSPPGSPVPGILQARTLERVAISFSNAWKWKWKWSRSVVSNSATPWTAAYQALPPIGFSRQEYWSGLPLPSPGQRELIEARPCLNELRLQADRRHRHSWQRREKSEHWNCFTVIYCKITALEPRVEGLQKV